VIAAPLVSAAFPTALVRDAHEGSDQTNPPRQISSGRMREAPRSELRNTETSPLQPVLLRGILIGMILVALSRSMRRIALA
jgi:hypothetical protein